MIPRPEVFRRLWPAVAILMALVLGLVVGQWTLVGAVAVAALLAGGWLVVKPELGFIISILTIVIGQLVRLPIPGSENGIIVNDVLLPPLIIAWGVRRLASRRWQLPSSSLTAPLWAMIALFVLSLLWNASQYTADQLMTGSLYLVRWVEYAAIFLMSVDFLRTIKRLRRYLWFIIGTGVVISLLGFIQLRIFPDFSFMVPAGWDPHVGRLLSTWFDPNFLGGYLAFLTTICLAIALSQSFIRARWWWLAITIMSVAIVFTFSRSGYVALAVGAGIVTLIKSRWLFLIGLLTAMSIVAFVPRVNQRVIGIRTVDETAKLRLVSWHNAWEVIQKHWWIGVGYNLYPIVQVDRGYVDTVQEHSASGSDSSFLTVWVTTGIFGILTYIWLFIAMLRECWRTWKDQQLDPIWRGFGLGMLAGLLGLFLHSQFVNSLLYPHIMQVLWILLAAVIMVRAQRTPLWS